MCVALICDTKRPSEEMVEAAWRTNSDGGGVAWREGGFVHWEKGLNLVEMKERCARLPIPFVAHFRIASSGPKKDTFCHPFPVDKNVSLATKGKTKGFVLFHNGTWGGWRQFLLDSIRFKPFRLPAGKWNDTRALAWIAAHHGVRALELIDEKTAVFGPEKGDLEIFGQMGGASGWSLVEEVWASNTFFQHNIRRGAGFTSGSSAGYHTTTPASLSQGTPGAIGTAVNYPLAQGTTTQSGASGVSSEADDLDDHRAAALVSSALASRTGGSSTVVPFARSSQGSGSSSLKIDLKKLTLAEATRLFKEGALSHKKWKKVRRRVEAQGQTPWQQHVSQP